MKKASQKYFVEPFVSGPLIIFTDGADMRIVPFGSSGKIGRNLGFLTNEYLLPLVVPKKDQF